MTAAAWVRAFALIAVASAGLNGVLLVAAYGTLSESAAWAIYHGAWANGALGILAGLVSVVSAVVVAVRTGPRLADVLGAVAALAAGSISAAIGFWLLIAWGFGHSH